MFEIHCPFCGKHLISDVIDSKEEVNGQWQCDSCMTNFLVKWLSEGPL